MAVSRTASSTAPSWTSKGCAGSWTTRPAVTAAGTWTPSSNRNAHAMRRSWSATRCSCAAWRRGVLEWRCISPCYSVSWNGNPPMAESLENCLVIAISSRALFDLEEGHRIFTERGLEAYARYQIEHEDKVLAA